MIYDFQKASILKRISAWLLDFILMLIITIGAILLLSVIFNYDGVSNDLNEYYEKYEELYGFNFTEVTEEIYNSYTEEQKQNYDIAYNKLTNDEGFLKVYSLVVNLTLLMTTFGILIGMLVVEFIVPLFLKNGQTVGKKCFGICLMMDNGVKIRTLPLLIRTVLGKFTIETMILVYFVIMLVFGNVNLIHMFITVAIIMINLVLIIVNKRKTLIHDLISYTVVVDKESQMIFETQDDLIRYKAQIAEKQINEKKTF